MATSGKILGCFTAMVRTAWACICRYSCQLVDRPPTLVVSYSSSITISTTPSSSCSRPGT